MVSIRFLTSVEVKDELGVVVERFAAGQLVPPGAMPVESRLYWLSTGLAETADEHPVSAAPAERAAERPARARRRRKAAPRA